jgi:hypothetical protein
MEIHHELSAVYGQNKKCKAMVQNVQKYGRPNVQDEE